MGGIVLAALIFLVRAIASRGGESRQGRPPSRLSKYWLDSWLLLVVPVRAGALGAFAWLAWRAVRSESIDLSTAALMVAWLVIAVPSLMLDRVLVPLGRDRMAYWWSRALVPLRGLTDPMAAAVADSARALARRRTADLRDCQGLAAELALRGCIADGAGLIAMAEIALADGDRVKARSFHRAAARLPGIWRRWHARRRAVRWLLHDAWERESWTEVLELEHPCRVHEASLVAGCLAIRMGRRPLHRLRLLAQWCTSPRHLMTWSHVLETLRLRPPERVPPADETALARALALHADVVATPWSPRERLDACARAWEEALAHAVPTAAGRRIARLGARIGPETVVKRMEALALHDIADVLRVGPGDDSVTNPCRLLHQARIAVVEERYAGWTAALGELERAPRSRVFASSECWIAWSTVLDAWTEMARVASPHELRMFLEDSWGSPCNSAARMANFHAELGVAGAIFAWILDTSRGLGANVKQELLVRNLACCRC